jgi:integrase
MIKKYHLRFVTIGKNRIYLRYFVTQDKKPLALNISCDLSLPSADVKKLNDNSYGGAIQKLCNQLKAEYINYIEHLYRKNNEESYPTPDEIRNYLDVTQKQIIMGVQVQIYLDNLKVADSTKKIYEYVLYKFKEYFESDIKNQTIVGIVHKKTPSNFIWWLKNRELFKKIEAQQENFEDIKNFSPLTLYNYEAIVLKFINYLADSYDITPITLSLHQPKYSNKWHIIENDVNRLLKYKPKTDRENEILDIIKLNIGIGLRINEILNIQKENCTVLKDCIEVRFAETKKNKERTIIVVQPVAIEVLKRHLSNKTLWTYQNYNIFNRDLKKIAKEVFKEETTKIYKIDTKNSGYVEVLKWQAISSHCFRRYAISRNIVNYGIDVARSYSGHTDYQMITRHYAEFMNKEDLKKKLLKK